MNLDTPERFGEIDRLDALGDVEGSAEQWAAAGDLPVVRFDLSAVDGIVITGMGGSGICGDIVAALAADRLDVPVIMHKGYGLPAHVGPRTLVIAVSYSGDTEETLSAVTAALERGARLFAVSSGGAVGAACGAADVPWVRIPGGGQPRHSMGYLLVPVLRALGLDDSLDEAIKVQRELVAGCGRDVAVSRNAAKRLALQLAAADLAVVYGGEGLAAVAAYRFKCQLNENAELHAFAGQVPEMNHNEIVGWQTPWALSDSTGVVLVRDVEGEHPRVRDRFALVDQLLEGRCAWVEHVEGEGGSRLARLAWLLLFADLVSVYTALALDRDPTPIAFIARLKQGLQR